MPDDASLTAADLDHAHQVIGGFIARCSVMDYRAGQMIARWFVGEADHFKQLGYVMHDLPFKQKHDVVTARLTAFHPEAEALRTVMDEADRIMQRRELVIHGLLSRGPGGFAVKSHAAARLVEDGDDILPLAEVPEWSARAVTATEEIQRLAMAFRRGR